MSTPPKAPKGLDAAGRALWRDMTSDYELNPAELRILEDACRQRDLAARIEAAFDDDPRMIVRGSAGQEVVNPLVAELRQYRAGTASLLARIKLPSDAPAKPAYEHGKQQREAAMARWSQLKAVQ